MIIVDTALRKRQAEGCCLVRDVPKDHSFTFADVEMPKGRVIDALWREQNAHFGLAAGTEWASVVNVRRGQRSFGVSSS
jgi:hypothetical protein